MLEPNTPDGDEAHEILAAEAFAMPAPDPTLAESEAHDVLAAEEFALPAPDPVLHHPPVVLPSDLTGTDEAVDVLAAEEFAMPAPAPAVDVAVPPRPSYEPWVRAAIVALAAWIGARVLARAVRRR